jgi:hypothetical protein
MPETHTDPIHRYTLTFEERPGYLYVYVEGPHDSYEISRSFWLRIAQRAAEIEAAGVMIDENIAENVPLADVFKLAAEIPEMGFGDIPIAFVDRYLDQNEANEFGALVAQNRGANGRVFNSTSAAEEWLLAA